MIADDPFAVPRFDSSFRERAFRHHQSGNKRMAQHIVGESKLLSNLANLSIKVRRNYRTGKPLQPLRQVRADLDRPGTLHLAD